MKPEDRRQAIMDVLMEAGTASVEELALRFGVSKMTVHRDLDDLERRGSCGRSMAALPFSRARNLKAIPVP